MESGTSKKCFTVVGWHNLNYGNILHYVFENGNLEELEMIYKNKDTRLLCAISGGNIKETMKEVKIEVENFINYWSDK